MSIDQKVMICGGHIDTRFLERFSIDRSACWERSIGVQNASEEILVTGSNMNRNKDRNMQVRWQRAADVPDHRDRAAEPPIAMISRRAI
nr:MULTISPECIES: hypothetical protein [unclassified Pseudomonas]